MSEQDGIIDLKNIAAAAKPADAPRLQTLSVEPAATESAIDRAYREHQEALGAEGMQQMNQALSIASSDSWGDVDGFAFLPIDRFRYRNGMQLDNSEEIARKKAQGWTEIPDGQVPLQHVPKLNPTIIVLRHSRRMLNEQEAAMLARLKDTGNASRALAGAVGDSRQIQGVQGDDFGTSKKDFASTLEALPDAEPKEALTPDQLNNLGG